MKNYLIIIGAPKAGTSSAAHILGAHPMICAPKWKEPRFFTDFIDKPWIGEDGVAFLKSITADRPAYDASFSERPDAPWRFDASTDYLSCEASPDLISKFRSAPGVGQVKLVAILRDPAERIISEYQHTVRDRFQTRSLAQSLAAEDERVATYDNPLFWHRRRSAYAAPLTRYKELFGDDLLILDYHSPPEGGPVDAILDFIGLPPVEDVPEQAKGANRSFVYKYPVLTWLTRQRWLIQIARRFTPKSYRKGIRTAVESANQTKYVPSQEDRAALADAVRDEFAACEASPLIDTTNWRTSRALLLGE